MIIPFFDSKRHYKKIAGKLDKAVRNVLSSGWYVLGEEVKKFENEFANYIGAGYGIGVNSGTDAIKIALRALGINPGDEVVTVSNTAVPTVSAIREVGAIPVYVDIDQYFTINSSLIEKKITPRTKALLIVHLYGGSCDMSSILRLAKKHKLKIVEDCAQAAGASYKNKLLGSFGTLSCFSFYPTKNLGAMGDGGMILTSDKKLADKCRALRMYGMKKGYHSEMEGWNSRLDEIQAAILSAKLPYLSDWNERRRKIAEMYKIGIKNPLVFLPEERSGSKHVFHLFVIRSPKRKALMELLKKSGVGSGIHYPFPIHLQKGYQFLKYKKGSLPATESASNEVLSLPIFPELKDEEIKHIIKVLNAFRT